MGDTAVADRNGRILGRAASAAIEALPPAASRFAYSGIVPSGADLGAWEYRPLPREAWCGAERLEAKQFTVELPLKDIPKVAELEKLRAPDGDRPEQEKLRRRIALRRALGDGESYPMPLWIWRLGDAGLVALPDEAYSDLQTELRAHFAGSPLWVLGTTNWMLGYLPPRDTYGQGRYQEVQSPYAPGCLEATIAAAREGLDGLRFVAV